MFQIDKLKFHASCILMLKCFCSRNDCRAHTIRYSRTFGRWVCRWLRWPSACIQYRRRIRQRWRPYSQRTPMRMAIKRCWSPKWWRYSSCSIILLTSRRRSWNTRYSQMSSRTLSTSVSKSSRTSVPISRRCWWGEVHFRSCSCCCHYCYCNTDAFAFPLPEPSMDTESGGGGCRHIGLGMQDNGLAAIDAETQYIAQLISIPLFHTLAHAHTRYLFVCSYVCTCCINLLPHSTHSAAPLSGTLCACVRCHWP